MTETNKEGNGLATEPIGRLLLRFSIPCVLSMLVSALYNIVDQIFIGQSVGYLGNAATNVVYPFTVVALALACWWGMEAPLCSAYPWAARTKPQAAAASAMASYSI